MISKSDLQSAIESALQEKGQRKFVQTVDLGINFRGIDFNKAENRVNLEVNLPKGKGKTQKVAVFGDGQVSTDARNAGADLVLAGDEIPKLAADKPRLKSMLEYEFLASPQLMAVVGKHLGQYLGTRGKLPKPLLGGAVKDLVARARGTVRVRSKGKFLPVVHVLIGSESMSASDLAENAAAILEKVSAKVSDQNIKNVYVKLTMGKPFFVGKKVEAVAKVQ